MEFVIVFTLILGICAWVIHLFFIITSLFSEQKWSIEIYYNAFKEGYIELFVIILIIIIGIISLIIYI